MLTVTYCESTQTIRQMPENYMLAMCCRGYWIMDPDFAADTRLVVALTLSLMQYENRWTRHGINAMTGMGEFLDCDYMIE